MILPITRSCRKDREEKKKDIGKKKKSEATGGKEGKGKKGLNERIRAPSLFRRHRRRTFPRRRKKKHEKTKRERKEEVPSPLYLLN